VLSYNGRDYVAASRAAGRSGIAILLRVILPSILPAILVMAAIDVGRAILMFSILSFLGLGARPRGARWYQKAPSSSINGGWRHFPPMPAH
jgi:peptide/nickel transport system permease protein